MVHWSDSGSIPRVSECIRAVFDVSTEDRKFVKSGEGLGLNTEQSRYSVAFAGPVWSGTGMVLTLTRSRRRVVMASWLMYWKLELMLQPVILTMTRDGSLMLVNSNGGRNAAEHQARTGEAQMVKTTASSASWLARRPTVGSGWF